MRRFLPCVYSILLLLAFVLPIGACGGGGGGGGGLSSATFSGTYVFAKLSKLRSFGTPANQEAKAQFGTVFADGMGMVTPTVGENDDAVVTGPMLQPAVVYSVATSGAFTLTGSTGGISSDGSTVLFMENTVSSTPSMGVAFRPVGAFSNATFSGNYHLGLLIGEEGTHASLVTSPALGQVVADGAGGVVIPRLLRNNAGVTAPLAAGATTYAVSGGGIFTATLPGGDCHGGISADGSFAVYSGGTTGGELPFIGTLLKKSVAATNATFSGTYWAVGLSSDPSSNNAYTAFVGTVTANGAGGMNYVTTTENNEGAISANNGLDDYVVSADGTLQTSDVAGIGGGPFRTGAVSSDGKYAFLCGGLGGDGPLLFLFVRK